MYRIYGNIIEKGVIYTFCPHCGEPLEDRTTKCPYCGKATGQNQIFSSSNNLLALLGFVLSFFVPLGGLICSIMGYRNADDYDGNGKGLAVAGIIISGLSILFTAILLAAYASVMLRMVIK